jgi:tetratricopeptide (TPR) repeat protein
MSLSPSDMNPEPTADGLWRQAQNQFDKGDLDAARAACESLLGMRPAHSGAHLMLSDLLARKDQQRGATRHALAAAAGMGRVTLEYIGAVCWRLVSVGEYGQAVSIIRRLDLAGIRTAPFLAEISQQLSIMEQHEDALRWLDLAIANGTRGESAHYLRGNYLRFLGRLAEAAEEYERCIALNPSLACAHWALANLDIAEGRERRVDRIRSILDARPAQDQDRAYLGYALFKELDAIDETDAAWRALTDGAIAKRRMIHHDAGEEARLFDELIAACGPGFVGPAKSEPADRIPIFVLGMPRTGTTVVERILGGHPQITLCGELIDFRKQYKWASDHAGAGIIDRTGVARLPSVDFGELGRRYLEHVAWRAPSTRYFTDKRPENWVVAGLVLKALPQAKIIHLRRDAMDTSFSNLKTLFAGTFYPYSYELAELASHYRGHVRLMHHWHDIAPGRILDVRYEDLVREPDVVARRVMAYCGLEYDAGQVRIESRDMAVSTASSAQVRQPIHGRNIGAWKRYARQLEPLRQSLEDEDLV